MPELYIYPKQGDPYTVSLTKKRTTLGRSPSNDLVLVDQFSSGCHAVISAAAGGYTIEDEGSKNGTFVNGRRISGEVALARGDEILIGSTRIVFDREFRTNVEMIPGTTFTHSSNTIIQVKDILRKPPSAAFLQGPEEGVDMSRLRTDQKAMAVLGEVSQALIYHMPLEKLLDHIMELITMNIPMDRGVLMLKEGRPEQLVSKVVRIKDGPLKTQNIFVSQSIVRTALEKNSAVLISDIQSDEQLRGQVSVVQAQIHSAICVPLWNNKEIIGLIYADRAALLGQFTEEDLRLLTLLANLAAVKIENARLFEESLEKSRMERELALAAEIQKNFLPRQDPDFPPYEVSGSTRACSHVGGDYYDFIPIDSDHLGIVIADVSGVGVSASLLMASVRASLHAEIPVTRDLAGLAVRLNEFVHSSSDSRSFVSFFFGLLERATGELTFVNAGHNPPFIVGTGGERRFLESTGFCLGMFPGVTYDRKTARLEPGEILCLYTDGIIESRDAAKEEFGDMRLGDRVFENAARPPREIIDRVFDDVFGFTACREPGDDMTLVIVKRGRPA